MLTNFKLNDDITRGLHANPRCWLFIPTQIRTTRHSEIISNGHAGQILTIVVSFRIRSVTKKITWWEGFILGLILGAFYIIKVNKPSDHVQRSTWLSRQENNYWMQREMEK